MRVNKICIDYIEYTSLDELEPGYIKLIESAKLATVNSYAPYSKFHVGAAVLLDNQKVVNGSNQENAAYPSGLCAERVAIFYANSKYPDNKVIAIAIAAKKQNVFCISPIPPCGSCRQVLLESEKRLKQPIKVILYGEDKIIVLNNASSLLPISFSEDFLMR
jgi:cytidine deaminase